MSRFSLPPTAKCPIKIKPGRPSAQPTRPFVPSKQLLSQAARPDIPQNNGLTNQSREIPALNKGDRLGDLEIIKKIGSGGLGIVYLAKDPDGARFVIKISRRTEYNPYLSHEVNVSRALKEISPHIVTLHYDGEYEGARYAVFEYCDGNTLAGEIQKGKLPAKEALRRIREICSGLQAAHDKDDKIYHGDLKPANIMLTAKEDLWITKILDWGLSESFEEGLLFGTHFYMSPEQMMCKPIDYRTDMYSLAVILYEMLTGGQRPYTPGLDPDSNSIDFLKLSAEKNKRMPDIPGARPEIQNLYHWMAEIKTEDRPETYRQIIDEIDKIDHILEGLTEEFDTLAENICRATNLKPLPPTKANPVPLTKPAVPRALASQT